MSINPARIAALAQHDYFERRIDKETNRAINVETAMLLIAIVASTFISMELIKVVVDGLLKKMGETNHLDLILVQDKALTAIMNRLTLLESDPKALACSAAFNECKKNNTSILAGAKCLSGWTDCVSNLTNCEKSQSLLPN